MKPFYIVDPDTGELIDPVTGEKAEMDYSIEDSDVPEQGNSGDAEPPAED